MILFDTSIWIDHLRKADPVAAVLLEQGRVMAHPFVIGELALGGLRQRDLVLGALRDLPSAPMARDDEVLDFVARYGLHGRGIGYIDAHLASVKLMPGAALWTRDKRLHAIAIQLEIAAVEKDKAGPSLED